MKIIYKDKNVIIINKPVGMPSQKDPTGDLDAMTATSNLLKENGEPSALWLVHRLDRGVGGLIAFARNKTSAARLSASVRDGSFKKQYYAVVEGEASGGELSDLLFKDSLKSKSFVVDTERKGAKLAVLRYTALDVKNTERGTRTLIKADLITGRFHQIRVQFASRGLPLVGDGKYGSRDKGARVPSLFSCSLTFPSVGGGELITEMPDTKVYPWSLFDEEKYI